MIPGGAKAEDVLAFDTGPGNMVIGRRNRKVIRTAFRSRRANRCLRQRVGGVIDQLLQSNFFRRKPPKTAGREEFGREFLREFLRSCKRSPRQDVVATATALTAKSIAHAIRRYTAQLPGP